MESDIYGILIADKEKYQKFNKRAASLAWKFGLDPEEVQQDVYLKLCVKRPELRNPNRFEVVCHDILKNHCINASKHQKVEDRGLDKLKGEARESTRRGGKI